MDKIIEAFFMVFQVPATSQNSIVQLTKSLMQSIENCALKCGMTKQQSLTVTNVTKQIFLESKSQRFEVCSCPFWCVYIYVIYGIYLFPKEKKDFLLLIVTQIVIFTEVFCSFFRTYYLEQLKSKQHTIAQLRVLFELVLSLDEVDDGNVFLMTFDGTHGPIQEPHHFHRNGQALNLERRVDWTMRLGFK